MSLSRGATGETLVRHVRSKRPISKLSYVRTEAMYTDRLSAKTDLSFNTLSAKHISSVIPAAPKTHNIMLKMDAQRKKKCVCCYEKRKYFLDRLQGDM